MTSLFMLCATQYHASCVDLSFRMCTADRVVLRRILKELRVSFPRTKPSVVIFTDALSVLSKLQNPTQKDLNKVETALVDLAAQSNLTLQWIPAHCGIQGNEQTDRLAREGCQLEQKDRYTSYTDEKTTIKTLSKKKNGSSNSQTTTSQTASTN